MNAMISRPARNFWLGIAVTLLGLGGLRMLGSDALLSAARSAPSDKERPATTDAEHAKREAAMQKALPGPIDIYADAVQIEHNTPLLPDVRFVDLVEVTGKDLLRFSDSKKNHWLIDPDAVIAFRVRGK